MADHAQNHEVHRSDDLKHGRLSKISPPALARIPVLCENHARVLGVLNATVDRKLTQVKQVFR
jgi:hypothetical protein